MSAAVCVPKFATVFSLYLLGSFILHNALAFTIPAAIVFLTLLLPCCVVCWIYLIYLGKKHARARLRYRHPFVFAAATGQFLILITSPRNCYGFKQGATCNPPGGIGFVIAVLLYILAIFLLLKTLRIEPSLPAG